MAAAAQPVRPFTTVEARFDNGTRYLWDGASDRVLANGQIYEGGIIASVGRISLRSESGAGRITITASGLDPQNLAIALAEDCYGRRGLLGRGFFAPDGTVAAHEIVLDGLIVLTRVTHQPDNSITWESTLEIGTSRGRQAVGRRRTHQDQITYSRYLRNGTGTTDDEGFQFVASVTKPIIWPAAGWVPKGVS